VSAAAVAVAVVSYDTRELLDRCLRALARDAEGGAEVWVVDNASSDGSAAMVAERHPWARLHASTENLGFGAAVNLVASRTETPWLVAANADTAPAPGAIARLLAAGEADRAAAILAPALRTPEGTLEHSVHPFPTLGFTLAYNLGAASAGPASRALAERWCLEHRWSGPRARHVPWAIGAFLLLRRAAFEQLGGFDEAQWMYAEDLDLAWRAARAGWRTRYEPSAEVQHEGSAATRAAWGEARTARWHAATYSWLARRRGPALARAIAAVNVSGAGARAAGHALAAAAGGGPEQAWRRDARLRDVRHHALGLRAR
jgi:N-acetylglucosaminyl-diphospho-decaprenol L-rhamnosyltransferase